MDLLGDIGAADQLTAARSENAVLQKRVKELTQQVKKLTIENQALLAEVEVYRKEASIPGVSKLAAGQSEKKMEFEEETPVEFIKTGNGVFPSENAVSLQGLHGNANPSCCALHPQDTLLATGGADSTLALSRWGGALSPNPDAAGKVVQEAIRIDCPAPVICLAFSLQSLGRALPVVAAGCMDGSVKLAAFSTVGVLNAKPLNHSTELKCAKYIKSMVWSPTEPILAIASADGKILIATVKGLILGEGEKYASQGNVTVDMMQTLHMNQTVESLCFSANGNHLICYARGTPYLSYFDLSKNFEQTKINLNRSGGGAVGGFEDHVSFAVLHMAMSPNGKFLALATDTSRNIIIDAISGQQIRNLYGHTNDGFSNPRVAWSCNGQYIMGNTQEDGSVCVWDVASSNIVKRLEGHTNPIRDLFSSRLGDTLVTTSFDKQVNVWLAPMET